ncbi:hypothetical protein LZC95_22070 [Pendulispora brunnea]|uniref:Uncharacterized protein n=1 Tax=Pendulispora brunnea TaxID=2905690 RepID=A0ABZ2KLG3_9BACT
MFIVSMLAWAKRNKQGSKLKSFARLGVYVAALSGVAFAFAAHNAHAGVAETALNFGRDMMPLKDYLQEPTALTLNGQNMVLATGISDKKAHEILDTYESYCRTSKDAFGQEWSKLVDQDANVKKQVASKFSGSFDMGVYRTEKTTGEGVVLCFMRGAESQKTLIEGLQSFEQTHDLGSLGKLRYAYVTTTKGGHTMVFTAWTDDHFRLDAFMPQEKDGAMQDSAGSDPAGIPRPPHAYRLLAAELRNSPFGAHVYRSASTPEQVREHYDHEMMKDGYAPLGWANDMYDAKAMNRMYLKGGVQIALSTKPDGDGSIVSIGEVGAAPNATAELESSPLNLTGARK